MRDAKGHEMEDIVFREIPSVTERDDGGGCKFWSKQGPVTRDGLYERPLTSKRA